MISGVVMVAAGWEHVALAWASLRTLRSVGCRWPGQLWHLGRKSITKEVELLFRRELDVEPVDVHAAARKDPRLSQSSLLSLVPMDQDEAEVHCLKGDPVAYYLAPVAVHLSNFSRVLLMFPDWVAFEDVCVDLAWLRDGTSAFFHAGSARVRDLAYYPRAWLSAGLSELEEESEEWEVDESVLFLDKAQCPSGALVVLDLVSSNVRTGLFPCGTQAYWRVAWELAGCSWTFSRFLPALLGFTTDGDFMGCGRGARDTSDGRLLGVHVQWAKYYWLSRPSRHVPIVVDQALLTLGPVWDAENSRLLAIGFMNYANFHFVRYANCSQCSLMHLREVMKGSFSSWVAVWSDAWREAFTAVASCPEDGIDVCWAAPDAQSCPPRPCTLVGVTEADLEAPWEEPLDVHELPLPLPQSVEELWAHTGYAKAQHWQRLLRLCCEHTESIEPIPIATSEISNVAGPTRVPDSLEGCDNASTRVSTHLSEIVKLFGSLAELVVATLEVPESKEPHCLRTCQLACSRQDVSTCQHRTVLNPL